MPVYNSNRYPIPSTWETKAASSRSQVALRYLTVEGLRVKYDGPGEDDRQAATIIANHPVPPDCPLYYFEILVVNKGHEGFIGVGFQTEDVVLHRLPGWEGHSYGYHGDDGHCFAGNGRGVPFGPKYTTGDTIGALLNRADRTISYFKNGTALGVAFHNVSEERLHPCVGLRTRGEEVVANFGAQPFVTDFQAVSSAYREQVMANVAAVPMPLVSSRGTPLLPQLLHDHLLHHRCSQTAAIIARDLLRTQGDASTSSQGDSNAQPDNAVSAEVAGRQVIFELVQAGKIEDAVQELTRLYTRAPLDNNPALEFRLKVAQFCELLRGSNSCGTCTSGSSTASSTEAALAYGRQVLAPHSPKGQAEDELLSDALSLLAYEQPEASPCGHLMSQATRNSLAEAVNGAILKHLGLPAVSPLERLLQQAVLTLEELKQGNHPQAIVLDFRRMVFGQQASVERSPRGQGGT